jgi:hypothetical protein
VELVAQGAAKVGLLAGGEAGGAPSEGTPGGEPAGGPPAPPAAAKLPRFGSIDALRGACLCIMIFANSGGGMYWFFEHA